MPDRVELRLSDCFEKPEREEGEPCLECKALILNINAGRNRELMRKCHRLAEYAYFIGEIRRYMSDGWSLEEATDFSIQKCLRKEVLSDILGKSAMEVRRMILTEIEESNLQRFSHSLHFPKTQDFLQPLLLPPGSDKFWYNSLLLFLISSLYDFIHMLCSFKANSLFI